MKESIYLNDDLAIVNFNKAYPKNGEVFLTSSTFSISCVLISSI